MGVWGFPAGVLVAGFYVGATPWDIKAERPVNSVDEQPTDRIIFKIFWMTKSSKEYASAFICLRPGDRLGQGILVFLSNLVGIERFAY